MTVPLIDLSAGNAASQAQAIDAALRESGFFALVGHGVPQPVFDAAFGASHRFFALADSDKRRWHIDGWAERAPKTPLAASPPQGGAQGLGRPGTLLKRGFDPIGWQSLDVGMPPDVKESFYTGNTSYGPNQWPDEALVPGFRAACEAYSAAMQQVALRLMALFAQGLGMAPHAFDGYMRDPICTTRLLHYPPQPAQAAPGQIGCGAHTDWGALTLLAQDDAGGLQVQRADGSWLDVQPLPGALVVNTGDMMPRWTNDRWRSTMHRVINQHSGRDRWSIAYFFDLDAEARIAPLPCCIGPGNPARYEPVTAGEHLIEMYKRTTVAA
ncbi:MAG: isopenicillin N synthase family oxygenase [Burkholderiales bacterium]|nr:isopenicillin N synthase family oxygenase [Burkholderiales bacterium]